MRLRQRGRRETRRVRDTHREAEREKLIERQTDGD